MAVGVSCDNCPEDAVYLIDDPTASPVFFCAAHLPDNQRHRVANGEFKLPSQASSTAQAAVPADPGAAAATPLATEPGNAATDALSSASAKAASKGK